MPTAEKPLRLHWKVRVHCLVQVIQEDGDGGKVVYCRKKDDEAPEG